MFFSFWTLQPFLPLPWWSQKTHWCSARCHEEPCRHPDWRQRSPLGLQRFLWARNKLVLFIPQHNQSSFDYDTQWCGHGIYHFCPHCIGENIVTWILLVQGIAGLFLLYLYGNRGELTVAGNDGPTCLPHIPAAPLLAVPSSHSQAVHIPHILQSTASWRLRNVLLSLSSKFWLLSVYNRLSGDLFIYKRLWTTYLPPGIVLDAGHVMAASSPTPRTGSFPLLKRVPSPNCTVNKESFVYMKKTVMWWPLMPC